MKTSNPKITSFQKTLKPVLIASIAGLMFGSAAAQADDIEIYLTPPPNPVPPNVLFILDESGSMSTSTSTGTRISDLRDAMTDILNDTDNDNINAGILSYTTNTGNNGPLSLRGVSDFGIIEDNRSTMVTAVAGLTANSYTPSVKALEAAVEWFKSSFSDTPANIAGTNGVYDSPLGNDPEGNWCRPNHMVFLTDGSPNSNDPNVYGLTAYPTAADTCENWWRLGL
jgi:type IV pilus assembly protein PilY1